MSSESITDGASVQAALKRKRKRNEPPQLGEVLDWISSGQVEPSLLSETLDKYSESVSPLVIEKLVEACPEALKHKDGYGKLLPLHLACAREAPLEIIQILTEAYPEALTESFEISGEDLIPVEYLLWSMSTKIEGSQTSIQNRDGQIYLEYSKWSMHNEGVGYAEWWEQEKPYRNLLEYRVLDFFCQRWPDVACTRAPFADDYETEGETKKDLGVEILHRHFCKDGNRLEAVEPLLSHRPELLTSKYYGQTILCRICYDGHDSHRVKLLLEICPELAQMRSAPCDGLFWFPGGALPLHLSLYRDVSRNQQNSKMVIQLLTKVLPDSIKMKLDAKLPLDLLIVSLRNQVALLPDYLPLLVDSPEQALHFYFREGGGGSDLDYSLSTVQTLLGIMDPASLQLPDANGDRPLHLALQGGFAKTNVLRALLVACPEACRLPNTQGDLPLHLALCSKVVNWKVMCELGDAFPASALIQDQEGWFPFQLAAQNQAPDQCKYEWSKSKDVDVPLTVTFHLLQLDPRSLLQSVGL